MSANFVERREYPRIYLRAYVFNQVVEVSRTGHDLLLLGLVDISAGGARLSHAEKDLSRLFKAGEACVCRVPGVKDSGALQRLGCEVRWADGRQMGVRFNQPLTLSALDLQRFFSQ